LIDGKLHERGIDASLESTVEGYRLYRVGKS
jgi:hypothetical protein